MVTLTFPDGAARDYDAGITAMEVAKSISKGLAKKVLAAKLDGDLVDASLPINNNHKIELVTAGSCFSRGGARTFPWHASDNRARD